MTDYTSIIASMGPQPGATPTPAFGAPAQPVSSVPPPPDVGAPANDPGAPATASSGLPGLPASSGAPAPGATDASNPYASIVSDVDQARTQAGRLALFGAKDNDPDKAAAAAALQPEIGGSANVIEKNLPAYQQQAQALRDGMTLQGNPALADWFANNPLAPKVASDDVSNLDTVSSISRQWSQGWSDAVNGNALARLYAQGAAADPARVASLEATMQAGVNSPASSGVVHFLATVAGGLADSFEHAAPMAAAGAIAGAGIGGMVAAAPSLGTLAPVSCLAEEVVVLLLASVPVTSV